MLLIDIRQEWENRRSAILSKDWSETNGFQRARDLADALDTALERLIWANLAEFDEDQRKTIFDQLAILAVGGYGRHEVCPHSDVDLVFLEGEETNLIQAFRNQMIRSIWDLGLTLGHRVASIRDSLSLARQDALTATSMLQFRCLFGSQDLADYLDLRLRQWLRRGAGSRLFEQVLAAIREEHDKFGATVHLLEPDVKRSKGGLRDIHLVGWLGHLRYESGDTHRLENLGALGAGDAATLATSHDFLLRIRHDLHARAGKAVDWLTRSEQLRLAQRWGYVDSPSLLAVEQFMRDYFRHSTAVADILDRFVEASRPRGMLAAARRSLMTRPLSEGIWLGPDRMVLSESIRQGLPQSLDAVLKVAEIASLHHVDLDRKSIERLRQAYREKPIHPDPLPVEVARRFLTFLGRPAAQHKLLRSFHQTGVLEHIIPEFEHARCLLQFNAYHKYTVDEHTFIMLQRAEELADSDSSLGRTYRRIARKDLLHLAILLHDLGKGFSEDHSEVGRRIAERIAARLQLDEEETGIVVFLVARHLAMSQLALERDTRDPKLQLALMREVASEQVLHMLYVMTAVDMMAVGPGTFNRWKADLLASVYHGVLRLFGEGPEDGDGERVETLRARLAREIGHEEDVCRLIDSLPAEYLEENTREDILIHLNAWRRRPPGTVRVFFRPQSETKTTTITVLTEDRLGEGIFSKIVGSLLAHRLEILSCRIHTLEDGTALDQFEVVDTQQAGQIGTERQERIAGTLERILAGELSVTDVLWSTRSSIFTPKPAVFATDRTRVVVDNVSSDTCTVIDVFTPNRRGVLYTVTKSIHRLGLTVVYAKIARYEDEVAGVFYVREIDGRKIRRDDRAEETRRYLLADIRRHATDPRSMGF